MGRKRPAVWLQSAMAALAVAGVACGSPARDDAAGRQRLSVGLGPLAGGLAGVFTATDLDLYASRGLDVDLHRFTSATLCVSAMISGQLPICAGISGIVLVNANLAGAGLKGISAQVDTIPYSLLVSPGIRTPADLAGKRLGINRPETSADHALRLGLARIGIDRRDVEVVSVGEQPQRLAALQTGSIDGTVISPPGALQALGEGFRILVDLSELRVAYPHSLVIAREDFLRDQPDIARRFIEASAEGMLRFKADRALGLEVLARHLEVSDPEDLEGTYALFSRTITDPPVVSEEGMRALLAVLAETNATVAAAGTDEFLDMTFVRDLQREGRYERLRDDARHTSARRNDAR